MPVTLSVKKFSAVAAIVRLPVPNPSFCQWKFWIVLLACFGFAGCASQSDRFQKSLYGSLGGGVSHLSPITDGTAFSVDDGQDAMFYGSIGVDLAERFSVELLHADMGTATLTPGPVAIDYTVKGALSGLWYGLGRSTVLARRSGGLAGYLRLGLSQMGYESSIELDVDDSPQVWAGIGGEYMFNDVVAARLELSSYDGDAQALQAGLVLRWGLSGGGRDVDASATKPDQQRIPDSEPDALPESVPQANTGQSPAPLPEPELKQPEIQPQIDKPAIDVLPTVDQPTIAEPGSVLLAGIQPGIAFVPGSAALTPDGAAAVRRLAVSIDRSSTPRVEIQSHTDGQNGSTAAMALSRQRVLVVARLLITEGVAKNRLAARAFGSNRPIASNATPEGRQRNNRIELAF